MDSMSKDQNLFSAKNLLLGLAVTTVIAVLILFLTGSLNFSNNSSVSVDTMPEPETCWEMTVGNNRYVSSYSGSSESYWRESLYAHRFCNSLTTNYHDDNDAVSAINYWLLTVKEDPVRLAEISTYLLQEQVTAISLVDEQCWASDKAIESFNKISAIFAKSKIQHVVLPAEYLSGNRNAAKITLKDGREFYLLAINGRIII